MQTNKTHPQLQRLLDEKGHFRVHRKGVSARGDLYHFLLAAPWPVFLAIVLAFYLVLNAGFALIYFSTEGGILNATPGSFADAFFFSVQTFSTIGYGQMAPKGILTNVIVTIEVMAGFMTLALVTGLVFAKFSRPTARVLFSRVAVVTEFEGKTVLMFRMANERANEIVEASVSASLGERILTKEGEKFMLLKQMKFIKERTSVFALSWTVMHPIDETSPLCGRNPDALQNFEIIVALNGIDATFSQPIHARHSYIPEEIIWHARFEDVISELPDGRRTIDLERFHEVKPE